MLKKLISFLLILIIVASFCACSGEKEEITGGTGKRLLPKMAEL